MFDFPQQKELLPRVQQQNLEWANRFGVSGYPTIILVDQEQRPFAITGYQEGGVEAFLGLMSDKREKRIRRDQFFSSYPTRTAEHGFPGGSHNVGRDGGAHGQPRY